MVKRRKKKKNNLFLKALVVCLVLGSVYFFVNRNFAESLNVPDSPNSTLSDVKWWNDEYAFRREILDVKDSGIVEVNHAELNLQNKSNLDGSDLKIVGGDQTFVEIPFQYNQFDSISTKLSFDSNVLNYKKYYLYYGNKGISGEMNKNAQKNILDSIKNIFSLGKEEETKLSISQSKKWVLKNSDDLKNYKVKINTQDLSSNSLSYSINNSTDLKKVDLNRDEVIIDLSSLKSGVHKIFFATNIGSSTERSNTITVRVSEPIYVAWTLDWEGVDPDQKYLDRITKLTSDFNIKTTHFFNPRILINSKISSARKKELVNWVKNRHDKFGEEIAMHLHMHFDMVEDAGVKAKYDAKTWDDGVSGFGTPSTEYDYDDYLKILKWGLNKMNEAGLPKPIGYRAGGWFADLDNLKAIEAAGFKYDSSGRPAFAIGTNKLSQPWELSSKSQPYKISKVDQNKDIEPTLNLYEIPNNGVDSYWSEAEEMIQSFYDNYTPGTTSDFSRIVTFLSHPEWFNIDDPKLRQLFSELNNYRIDLDNGPVKFVTLSEWMELEGVGN